MKRMKINLYLSDFILNILFIPVKKMFSCDKINVIHR